MSYMLRLWLNKKVKKSLQYLELLLMWSSGLVQIQQLKKYKHIIFDSF